MTVGSERNLFAADKRDFSGNIPPRKRKLEKLFCGEQGEKNAAGFSFCLLLYKRKNRFFAARKQVRRQGRRGGERARTAGGGATRKQGQRECKGNDKKEGRRREVEGGGKAKGL